MLDLSMLIGMYRKMHNIITTLTTLTTELINQNTANPLPSRGLTPLQITYALSANQLQINSHKSQINLQIKNFLVFSSIFFVNYIENHKNNAQQLYVHLGVHSVIAK